jgi:sugar phosphate isomerase/epimerase
MKTNLTAGIPWVAGWLAAAVLNLAAAAPGKAGIGPSFKGRVGLQLYSLRDSFKADVPGSFAKVRAFGFRYVELAGTYGKSSAEFNRTLAEYGLKAIAAHFPYEKYRDDAESVAREAKALGLKYAGVAWIPHEGDFDEAECRAAAEVFNRAGSVLARHGIRFFYHVHGYEFQPCPGGTLFDRLMEWTDRKTVAFEMDIFWVVFPGQDPVKLLTKYGKRWQLLHLKDMRRGVQLGSLAGGTDVRNDVALGAGQIDLPPLLRAAKKAGAKWYFIEDESPSVEIQVPDSLRYLENVRF